MSPEKSDDDLISWGDDFLAADEMKLTKGHADAISISSGSSEEVLMIEHCDRKQKAKMLNKSSTNQAKDPCSEKQKMSPLKKMTMKLGIQLKSMIGRKMD